MLHVGISYSFEKKKRLFIVDYIKPSPVYQVKCKLVDFMHTCCIYIPHFSTVYLSYLYLFILLACEPYLLQYRVQK